MIRFSYHDDVPENDREFASLAIALHKTVPCTESALYDGETLLAYRQQHGRWVEWALTDAGRRCLAQEARG